MLVNYSFLNKYIALQAMADKCLTYWTNLPFFVKRTPKYLKDFTISISAPATEKDTVRIRL